MWAGKQQQQPSCGPASPSVCLRPCLPQAGCPHWMERCQGNVLPRCQGKAGLGKGPRTGGECVALGGKGSSWGLVGAGAGQGDVGPGWDVPLSLLSLGGEIQGGRDGEEEGKLTQISSSPPQCSSQLGQVLVSCWGALGEDLECPSPQSPRAVPQTPPG